MADMKALKSENIIDLVKDSEIKSPSEVKRTFEYNLNDKSAKAKLLKGARRIPFDIVHKTASSNLVFSLGAWHHVVLPSIKYWNQVKGEKTCKVDSIEIKIASVDIGREASGKHIDTQVIFYANRDKVVCHFYNTTQLIMINGHGYANVIQVFLKPYFESKIALNLEEVSSYNKLVLETLGSKQVKRSTVRYKQGSTFSCKGCNYTAKSLAMLNKHKETGHALSFNSSRSLSSSSLVLPLKHSTRNNSISEALMQENMTITSIISDQGTKAPLEENTLKYTCLDCNFATTEKELMSKHVKGLHGDTSSTDPNFICKVCDHELQGAEDYNIHVKTHDPIPPDESNNISVIIEVNHPVFKCEVCSNEFQCVVDLNAHVEFKHGGKQNEAEPKQEDKILCRKCPFICENMMQLDTHMEYRHGKNRMKSQSTGKDNGDLSLVELTCRKCEFEGLTREDMNKHMSKHGHDQCHKCEFVAADRIELYQHNQSKHQEVRVEISSLSIISCHQCEYKCKLNMQMHQHIKRNHLPEGKKYKCNSCNFESDFLVKMYEHKLANHPEIPIDFNPKTTSVKDMALNLIAEQNIEIMEEILHLKEGLKLAFEQLSDEIRGKFEIFESDSNRKDEAIKSAFFSMNTQIVNLEKTTAGALNSISSSRPKSSQATTPPPPPATWTSGLGPAAPARPVRSKRKRSVYLQKPKVLFIGDSVGHNANFASLEKGSKSRIKTVKAYSSVEDSNARWPDKNFSDVTPAALINTPEYDAFSHLILSAPTVDISNLNTAKLTENDSIEGFKQKMIASCHNMFCVAQNAIIKHPELKKVVIMEHGPRYDEKNVDPIGLKSKLAKFANSTFHQMWHTSDMKNRIVVGKHTLDCAGNQIASRYKDDWTGRYDGVHMYGRHGMLAYTGSVMEIIKSVLPTPPHSDHTTCPQALYQKEKKMSAPIYQSNKSRYSVPVSNQFDILGN